MSRYLMIPTSSSSLLSFILSLLYWKGNLCLLRNRLRSIEIALQRALRLRSPICKRPNLLPIRYRILSYLLTLHFIPLDLSSPYSSLVYIHNDHRGMPMTDITFIEDGNHNSFLGDRINGRKREMLAHIYSKLVGHLTSPYLFTEVPALQVYRNSNQPVYIRYSVVIFYPSLSLYYYNRPC